MGTTFTMGTGRRCGLFALALSLLLALPSFSWADGHTAADILIAREESLAGLQRLSREALQLSRAQDEELERLSQIAESCRTFWIEHRESLTEARTSIEKSLTQVKSLIDYCKLQSQELTRVSELLSEAKEKSAILQTDLDLLSNDLETSLSFSNQSSDALRNSQASLEAYQARRSVDMVVTGLLAAGVGIVLWEVLVKDWIWPPE